MTAETNRRGVCERCGKTVELRQSGTVAVSAHAAPGSASFEWFVAPTDAPQAARECTGTARTLRHKVGFVTLYVQPDGTEVTR